MTQGKHIVKVHLVEKDNHNLQKVKASCEFETKEKADAWTKNLVKWIDKK